MFFQIKCGNDYDFVNFGYFFDFVYFVFDDYFYDNMVFGRCFQFL